MRSAGPAVGADDVRVEVRAAPSPAALAEWDALVARVPGTDVTQSSAWARVRAVERMRPVYVLARRDGRLVGGAQVLLRPLPVLGRVGYVPYGPVVDDPAGARPQTARALARALVGLSGVRLLCVQPPEDGADLRAELVTLGFRPSALRIAPVGSARLDLRRDLEDLRRGLSGRLGRWTRRWADAGVVVRPGGAGDVPLLAALMTAAAQAQGYARPPRTEYLQHLYRELAAAGQVALFVGEVDGVPVGAELVTVCGSTVRSRLCGFDRDGPGGRLSVPAAIRWEVLRWARTAGYTCFDLGGLGEATLPDAVDRGLRAGADWPGADVAKMRLGASAYRYPGPVELITPAPLRTAYDAVLGSPRGRARLARLETALRARRAPGPHLRGSGRSDAPRRSEPRRGRVASGEPQPTSQQRDTVGADHGCPAPGQEIP